MNWDKLEHNFGTTKLGNKYSVIFNYFGEEEISLKDIITTCGCTVPSFDLKTRKLELELSMNNLGDVNKTIIINYPSGKQDLLTLKANVIV